MIRLKIIGKRGKRELFLVDLESKEVFNDKGNKLKNKNKIDEILIKAETIQKVKGNLN